jgi:hypothetical protein
MSGYYKPGVGLGLNNLGQVAALGTETTMTTLTATPAWVWWAWRAVSMAGAGASAYHGYKRNRGSIGWTIGWAFLGGLAPPITVGVAFAQGFGKPKVRKNRRRRRTSRPRRRTSR